MSIGGQVSMTGDTDDFPATMRPSPIGTDNLAAQRIAISKETLLLALAAFRQKVVPTKSDVIAPLAS
jgi:hypothetical protein